MKKNNPQDNLKNVSLCTVFVYLALTLFVGYISYYLIINPESPILIILSAIVTIVFIVLTGENTTLLLRKRKDLKKHPDKYNSETDEYYVIRNSKLKEMDIVNAFTNTFILFMSELIFTFLYFYLGYKYNGFRAPIFVFVLISMVLIYFLIKYINVLNIYYKKWKKHHKKEIYRLNQKEIGYFIKNSSVLGIVPIIIVTWYHTDKLFEFYLIRYSILCMVFTYIIGFIIYHLGNVPEKKKRLFFIKS